MIMNYIDERPDVAAANIKLIRRFLFSAILAAILVQIFLVESFLQATLVLFSALTSLIVVNYGLGRHLAEGEFFSRIVLLSVTFSLLTGGLLSKSLLLQRFTDGLSNPEETILFANFAIIVMLFAHFLYVFVGRNTQNMFRGLKNLYARAGVFSKVEKMDIIIISILGLIAIIVTWLLNFNSYSTTNSGSIQFLTFLYCAPVISIFYGKKNNRFTFFIVIVFVLISLLITSVTGRRGFFADYIWSIIFAFFMCLLLGVYEIKRRTVFRLFFVLILAYPFFMLFERVSSAVVSVRTSYYENLDYMENINAIINEIASEKPKEISVSKEAVDFSEEYTGNFMIDRLLFIKPLDNLVGYGSVSGVKEVVTSASITQFFIYLPSVFQTLAPWDINLAESGDGATVMDQARCAATGACGPTFIFGSWLYMANIIFGDFVGMIFIFLVSFFVFMVYDFLSMYVDSSNKKAISYYAMISAGSVWFALYSPSIVELLLNYLLFLPKNIIVAIIVFSLVRSFRKFFFR